jgi:hypothetical protein
VFGQLIPLAHPMRYAHKFVRFDEFTQNVWNSDQPIDGGIAANWKGGTPEFDIRSKII